MSELPNELYQKDNAKEHSKPESGKKDVPSHPGNPNKRIHDKQSGTGRGKEISKNGAGGKYTWGTSDKDLEREAYQDEQYDDAEEEAEPKK